MRAPATSEHVRIDTGVEQGDTITPFYDPMIAKLIVWDETRELAVQRMAAALGEFQIVGVTNNIEFLQRLVTSPSFAETPPGYEPHRARADMVASRRGRAVTGGVGAGGVGRVAA